jgi:hypothetical protein
VHTEQHSGFATHNGGFLNLDHTATTPSACATTSAGERERANMHAHGLQCRFVSKRRRLGPSGPAVL